MSRYSELIFTATVFIISLALFFFVPSRDILERSGHQIARGRVLSTDDSMVEQYGVVNQGDQTAVVQMDDDGRSITCYNTLVGDPEVDFFYSASDRVLISRTPAASGEMMEHLVGPDRLKIILFLSLLFAGMVIAVAGWTGIKALLSFTFTILVIWKILIPGALAGIPPVLLSLGVVTVLTATITLLVGGLNRKGLSAFLGGEFGLLTACALALLVSRYFHLPGLNRPFAKSLIFVEPNLDVYGLFISGIFISASGAVMDLAMDIAAATHEIHYHHPEITMRRLFSSALKVGQAVIGTMTTTLLLAYSGGFIMMLMYFEVQKIPLLVMLNSTSVASEILVTLVGSFGLVTVAPFTALTAAFLYAAKR
ncbi:MAG: YibE/F family protein [Kiritimatiellia bacterium]